MSLLQWMMDLGLVSSLLLKATAVLAVIGTATWCARKMSAELRHLGWSLALLGLALVPVLGLVAPSLDIPVHDASMTVIAAPSSEARVVDAQQETVLPAAVAAELAPVTRSNSVSFESVLMMLIGAGVVFLLAQLVVGIVRAWRITRRASDLEDRQVLALVHQLASDLSVGRPVRVKVTSEMSVPSTWGALNPVILLPSDALDWADEGLRAALIHELSHIRRWDWSTQIAARAIRAVHWYNPLAWFAVRELLYEAERACDDEVIRSSSSGATYARQLVDLAARARTSSPGVAMARVSRLHGRISSILDESRQRRSVGRKPTILAVIVAAAMFTVTAQLTLVEAQQPRDRFVPPAQRNVSADLPPLLVASWNGDAVDVAQLIARGVDPNQSVPGQGTPLILAASRGHRDIVAMLLDAGADPNLIEGQGPRTLPRSPMGAAALYGHAEIVQLLLDADARVDIRPRGDATPLMKASRGGHVDVASVLIEAGANVNRVVDGDGTPLIEAARSGHEEIVEQLLDAGADPTIAVSGDGSPMIAAAQGGYGQIVERLHAGGADVDEFVDGDESPLYHAAANGDENLAATLADLGADVDQVWPGDGTALIVAARSGDLETVRELIARGADVERAVDGDGNPLLVASGRGDVAIVETLLAHGADPNSSVRGDGSPLIRAAASGQLEVAETLIANGADVDMAVPGDENPLIQAAANGRLALVQLLLDHGADINVRIRANAEWRTPLSMAERGKHADVVDLLLSRGAVR